MDNEKEYNMSFKITKTKTLPEGVKLYKKAAKVESSGKEYFPLLQMEVGESFYVGGRDARSMRGSIHMKRRTQGAKFVSRTEETNTKYGVRVYRVK